MKKNHAKIKMDKIECHDIHIPIFVKKIGNIIEKNVPLAIESFKIQEQEGNTSILGLDLIVSPDLNVFPLFSREGRLVLIFYDKSVDFKDAYNFYFNIDDEQEEGQE